MRLQQLVAGWRGAERGQPLSDLHAECAAAVGPGGRHLLPAGVLHVRRLDTTTLAAALQRRPGQPRGAVLSFRVAPHGGFDAALVPVGPAGEPADRFLLAIEEELPLRDQVALYGHAIGHLLLNRESRQMGQLLPLDPQDGYSHAEILGELRLLENVRRPLDRRVLETYPLLAGLLGAREQPPASLTDMTVDLRQRLAHAGWRGQLVEAPYTFTAGRVYISGNSVRRGPKLTADALLRAEASLPLALVQTRRAGETLEVAERRLMEYARERLALPFAYLLDSDGTVHELDWSAGRDAVRRALGALPGRDELWDRWSAALDLEDRNARDTLLYPYQLSRSRPRYYQEAAINRAVIAALRARRGLRQPRILLTLATGTGKTKVAFQIVWKLKRARAIGNVLFITDRDYLLGQAMDNEFAPFGDARHRIQGGTNTSRDIYFATYQAIAEDERRKGLYREYPSNFFDLVIIDECHRGSAQDESNWRAILEYFTDAVQVGLTATPLRDDNVQTYEYFGEPITIYSLRTGIQDGFLAPYRVRRIVMSTVAEPVRSSEESTPHATVTSALETSATLRARTQTVAEHLAEYMRRTGPFAKTIVFCVDQAHAEDMRLALEAAMSEQVARYPGYVERIVADEGQEGKRALGRFSTPDERTPVIVTTSKLLTTGVDVPTCKNIVLARPIGSMVEFKQIIGRGTRLHEPEKTWFTILDYSGATQLFFDPEFDGDPELVEVEPLVPEPIQRAAPLPQSPEQLADEPVLPIVEPGDTEVVDADGVAHETEVPGPVTGDGARAPATIKAPAAEHQPPSEPVQVGGDDGAMPYEVTAAPKGPEIQEDPGGYISRSGIPEITTYTPASDGRVIKVTGEIVYELGPDGTTLRVLSFRDYAAAALEGLAPTSTDLRQRWLRDEQRAEIRRRLTEEGVDLQTLATSMGQPDADPLDLLLHVAFGQPVLSRRDRADRVRREQEAFFARHSPAARVILDTVLQKYVTGEAQDVNDPELLKVLPLSSQGTFVELAQRFGGGAKVRSALRELQELLYSA